MTLLALLCTTAPDAWAAGAAHIPADARAGIWAELAGLGLVDDDGPTPKGRRLAAVSTAALRAYDAAYPLEASQKPVQAEAAAADIAPRPRAARAGGAMPRVRDYETYTAARAAAFRAAGLDCRSPLDLFMKRTVSAAVPPRWADCKIFGGTARGPRSCRVPRAEYWPGGRYPEGLGVVDGPIEPGPVRPWAQRGQSRVCNGGYLEWLASDERVMAGEGYGYQRDDHGEQTGPLRKLAVPSQIIRQPELLAAD